MMPKDKTAIFVQPSSWTRTPGEVVDHSFSNYRLLGNPECLESGLPSDRTRSLPTDHIGNALRTVLIENQSQENDIWIFHNDALRLPLDLTKDAFRPSLLSIVGVQSIEDPSPILASYQPRDLTILPWETLRYFDFTKLEWNPREDYLLSYETRINRRGFSPYLLPVENPESKYPNIGDFISESKLLDFEARPFHRHKILSALKQCPLVKEEGLSLLVDLTHIRNGYNGTMEYGRNLFKGLLEVYPESAFSTVKAIGEPRHIEFHGISSDDLIEKSDTTLFDVCFRPYQIDKPTHFADVIFRGRRFIISQLDAIGSRCDYIYDSTTRFYQKMGMAASDGVICISEYGLRDAFAFFDLDPSDKPCRAILLAMEDAENHPELECEDQPKSFMVIGSWRYDHKMLRPALDAVRLFEEKHQGEVIFHFLGDLSGEKDLPACVKYHKHDQSQADLDRLFNSVHGFIFPSVYEGYGLPIMHALRFKKPVLIADTEVNQEIQQVFAGSKVTFFDSEMNLKAALDTFVREAGTANIPERPRDWLEVARETLDFLAECAIQSPSDTALRRQSRESLLLAACQLEGGSDIPPRADRSGAMSVASEQTPMHPAVSGIPDSSILPKSLASAWIQSRDRLPEPLVRFLKAIRKRIPDGT